MIIRCEFVLDNLKCYALYSHITCQTKRYLNLCYYVSCKKAKMSDSTLLVKGKKAGFLVKVNLVKHYINMRALDKTKAKSVFCAHV